MKVFRIINRSIRDAFKSVFRNFSLSIASIMCATITLIVVAISLVIAGNVKNATKELEKELSIIVYLESDSSNEDINFLESKLKNDDKIGEVIVKTKEEWKKEVSEYNTSLKTIFDNYDSNPLLDSLIVKVKDAKDLEHVTTEIRKMDKVNDASYGEDTVNNIISIFDVVEKVALVVVISLIFVTAFLITNTIKLAIYSRREEIEIMRLVGASNIAIKLPFVFEGFIIGILGSIIPNIIAIYGYIIVYGKLNGHILSDVVPLISPYYFIFYIALIVLALGSLIGMFGSLRAVRKYLKI